MGTASYFSPEQAQGAQPDPRSDLYSLGIVMYEMVAGRPPFTGENPVAIAYKQVHDQPTPLNKIVDGIPRPFEAIVAKLLAKDPEAALLERPRTARRPAPVPQRRAGAGAGRRRRATGHARRAASRASRRPPSPRRRWRAAPTQRGPAPSHPQIAGAPTTTIAAPTRSRPHALPARRLARRPLLPGPPLAHRLVRAGGVHRPDRARRRRAARLPEPDQGRRRGRHHRAHPRQLLQPAARLGHRRAAVARAHLPGDPRGERARCPSSSCTAPTPRPARWSPRAR